MINKDEVYVMNQPRKSLLSIVVVDSDPDEVIHAGIDKLAAISDVIFLFSSELFPFVSEYDKRKFTNLYEACGFIELSSCDLGEAFFKTLQYDRKIFKSHQGVSITMLSLISSFNKKTFDNLVKINNSTVSKPVLKVRRLDVNELSEIYKLPIKKEDGFFSRFLKKDIEECNSLINCRYTSSSNVIYFGNPTSDIILLCEEGSMKNYINTFDTMSDLRYLLASLFKYLAIDILNHDVEELEINKLK